MNKTLTVRQAQLDELRPELERDYVLRLVAWVRGQHPAVAESHSAEALYDRVRACIDRARGHGFTSKRDVARFVDLDFRWGHRFEHEAPRQWMLPMLANAGLTPATRLYRIECRLERLAAVAAQAALEEQDA